MVFQNKWSGGFQIFWGILLFLIFMFSNFFFYDTSFTFNELFYLVLAFIVLMVYFLSAGSFKLTLPKVTINHKSLIWLVLASLTMIFMMLLNQIPLHIIAVFKSNMILMNTVAILATAIFEESLCRGLFLSGFLDHQVSYDNSYKLTRASIYSSILFGVLHFSNLIGTNVNPEAIVQQVFYATVVGMFFSALRITTNGLLFPIILHFILDWSPVSEIKSSGADNWLLLLVVFLPILIFSTGYLVNLDLQDLNIEYKK